MGVLPRQGSVFPTSVPERGSLAIRTQRLGPGQVVDGFRIPILLNQQCIELVSLDVGQIGSYQPPNEAFQPPPMCKQRSGDVDELHFRELVSQKLNGFVPLMQMFGYATQLRNLSSGRANYSMEFYQYTPLSKSVQEEVLKKFQDNKK